MEEHFKYEPSQEDFNSFIIKSLKKLGLKVSKNKINVSDNAYENVLIAYKKEEKFEVFIRKRISNYYEFNINKIPKTFKLKFGCELETCFNLNCTTDKFDEFIKYNLKVLKSEDLQEEDPGGTILRWKRMIIFHLKTNIVPHLSKKFLKKYKYAYIMGYHSENGFYMDLSNGEMVENFKKIDNYKTLQFSQDGSLKCGDTSIEDKNLSVHCEIISPVLDSISDIKLLYDNIISKSCNTSNSSTGFHVNISIIDEEGKKFHLSDLFKFEFANTMYKFEKEKYELYRGEGSVYAESVAKFLENNFENFKKFIKLKDNSNIITKEEFFKDYGLKNYLYIEAISGHTTVNHKKNLDIFEFRIYPSKNDTKLLLSYTEESLDIMNNVMNFYYKNCEKICDKYKEIKEKYEIDKPYIKSFYEFCYRDYEGKISDLIVSNVISIFILFGSMGKGDFYSNSLPEETEMEVEKITYVPFLFFFEDVKKIKEKIMVEKIQKGTHIYYMKLYDEDVITQITVEITYNPEEDYIKIVNL